jgi:hypothetical protein
VEYMYRDQEEIAGDKAGIKRGLNNSKATMMLTIWL